MNLIQPTITSTTVGKQHLAKCNSPHSQQESKMQNLGAILKMTERSCGFKAKPFKTIVIQVYAPTSNNKEAEFEDLQDLLEVTQKKYVLFIIMD